MDATATALATLTKYQALAIRMSGPIFAPDFVVHAAQCIERGEMGAAAGLISRARDAADRFGIRRNKALWMAAIDEIEKLTGAKPVPCVHVVEV